MHFTSKLQLSVVYPGESYAIKPCLQLNEPGGFKGIDGSGAFTDGKVWWSYCSKLWEALLVTKKSVLSLQKLKLNCLLYSLDICDGLLNSVIMVLGSGPNFLWILYASQYNFIRIILCKSLNDYSHIARAFLLCHGTLYNGYK